MFGNALPLLLNFLLMLRRIALRRLLLPNVPHGNSPSLIPVGGGLFGACRNAGAARLMKSCARAAARDHHTVSRIYFFGRHFLPDSLSRICSDISQSPRPVAIARSVMVECALTDAKGRCASKDMAR